LKKTFYSNGKLLITAEYLVLDGAIALALPTKFGQNLIVEPRNNQEIAWKSFDSDGSIWFDEMISFEEISNKILSENKSKKNTLIEILHQGFIQNPDFIKNFDGYQITTHLTFPKFWGLGTSSTLINNIAQWLEIDAFELLKNSFGGSGYDIACAQNDFPILYRLENGVPIVEVVNFNPKFKEHIYFVYLNQKQSSKSAIANYRNKNYDLEIIIPLINTVTSEILNSKDFQKFSTSIRNHEVVLSTVLETPKVKDIMFSDFKGEIKSLGAWGGDFVMVTSKENPTQYFKDKGFETILKYSEMILNSD
jgi:mevalonate kinase